MPTTVISGQSFNAFSTTASDSSGLTTALATPGRFIFVKTTPAKLALYVASWTYRQMDAPIFKVRIASQTGMLFYQMRKFVFIIAF
jgi:hypothetical protein